MTRALLILAAVTGCNTPPPSLRIELAGPPSQACPSTNCAEVPMACETVMSIRIVDPADPSVPYLSQCAEVPQNRKKDLCSLAAVDLLPIAIPITDVEVQIAIYPRDALPIDPISGLPVCPADVKYDVARGFPVDQANTPALGGRTFYRPGDTEVVVTLGCADSMALNDESCVGAATIGVTSTVADFDTRISISPQLADRISLLVGEPHELNGAFVLNPADVRPLDRTVSGPTPAWGGEVDLAFQTTACVGALEDFAQATTSLTCRRIMPPVAGQLDLPGTRLARSSLQQILSALQLPVFPDAGLTVGILVDYQNAPLPGFVVQATSGSVEYLSADRTTTVSGPTTSNGIFVSTDAPFGTVFSSAGTPLMVVSGVGGQVEGKVTVVVLQFEPPVIE